MTDATTNTAEAGEQAQESNGEVSGFTPISSQEDLDRIIQKRLDRERSKFSDYDDLKEAAGKVAGLEASNADLTAKVQGYESRDARADLVSKVAKDKGVSADLLARMAGESEDDLSAAADVIKEQLKVTGPVVPTAGEAPDKKPTSPELEAARSLFGGN